MRPKEINILGKKYSITYCDNPADVDIYRRKSLWGQVDYWTRTIRIYDNGQSQQDVLEGIIHEMLHVIAEELKMGLRHDKNHEELGLLALAIADTLTRNGWL